MAFTVGSICSGIEAASVALMPLGFEFQWFSEIAPFPSKLLAEKYPSIPNLGDMNDIPNLLRKGKIYAPDMLCGGTPCQAFSTAGWKQGLNDYRGNLSLKFVEIANANDSARFKLGKPPSLILWENVEGVLTDKTNAFGSLISSLAGIDDILPMTGKWPGSGFLIGPRRNVVWRVLDAKYFGVPQQRKRLYLCAGPPLCCDTDLITDKILSNNHENEYKTYSGPIKFVKENISFELFRTFTDCIFSSYATKWNGNAAANNGSLFVVQDKRIRRFSPLECERLMGFPENYTKILGAKKSQRYNALGNSWAIPVIRWIGEKIRKNLNVLYSAPPQYYQCNSSKPWKIFDLKLGEKPENPTLGDLQQIVTSKDVPDIYISPVGCAGILRRSRERGLAINKRLSEILQEISSTMDCKEIERRSRVQRRGKFSSRPQQTSLI